MPALYLCPTSALIGRAFPGDAVPLISPVFHCVACPLMVCAAYSQPRSGATESIQDEAESETRSIPEVHGGSGSVLSESIRSEATPHSGAHSRQQRRGRRSGSEATESVAYTEPDDDEDGSESYSNSVPGKASGSRGKTGKQERFPAYGLHLLFVL